MSQLRRSAAGERETVATLADDADSVQLDQTLNSKQCRALQPVGRCNQRLTEPATKQALTVGSFGGGLQCLADSGDIGKHPQVSHMPDGQAGWVCPPDASSLSPCR